MRLAFELQTVKTVKDRLSFSVWVDIIQSTEGLTRTRRHRKEEFAFLPDLKEFAFSVLGEWKHWSSLDLGLKIAPLTSLVLRSLDSD